MKQIHKKNKLLFILPLTLLIAALLSFAVFRPRNTGNNSEGSEDGLTGIRYEPATEEEKAEADKNKERLSERMDLEDQEESTSQKQVTPVISSTGQDQRSKALEVSAFVPGIFEDGGTCTLTLSKSGTVVTTTRTGTKNVSDTSCGFMVIEYDKLTPGTWQATVKYSSINTSGTSKPTEVVIN